MHKETDMRTHENIVVIRYTQCNTLQHTATHCNTLQHTATHCNTLQHTATHKRTHMQALPLSDTHSAIHCNTLQHTATHCNTLQHTIEHTCEHCRYQIRTVHSVYATHCINSTLFWQNAFCVFNMIVLMCWISYWVYTVHSVYVHTFCIHKIHSIFFHDINSLIFCIHRMQSVYFIL